MEYLSYNLAANGRQGLSLVALLLIATAFAGCGEKGNSTQVAAKINSDEITVTQVNAALANVPATPGKTPDQAKQEVLNNLIVQNLADQQAVKMKLDRTPAVMQAIENAKNTILARAYMDPIISGIPKPTQVDVHKFYTDHPELFSNRHIYSIKELEMEAKPDLAASIRDMAGKDESLESIAAWLKSKNIASSVQTGVKPAEQLPLDMLPRFEKLGAGKLMVIELSKTISVVQVLNAKAEPVEESVATPVILDYLMNSKKSEALDNEIKSLKAGAKIEYFGEFKPGSNSTTEVKTTATESSGKTPAQSSTPDISKGIASLK
ncbi:EpsD family peptidyl-prolyl cis-trans isomerase [Sideroxydans sp. CL21]|uniref:EpsD family peptidyl-prolyl cis-trans isomerase n=1 Tax=Sideroxydans sp. CL21 TaxID=2600596 RepID=UPI0012AAA3AA|nr:EpsD family peptidyl-prolyl cis-trans isomerase [Sideroxydans sp. CL21]VVC83045.1 hypothetical protein [Sideroxydans sp. CL21]